MGYHLAQKLNKNLKKGTCQSVRVIRVSTTKCLNCTLALMSLNYRNQIVIYHTLGEICTSNQTQILKALNHCSVSSVLVTVTATSFNYGNRTHIYSLRTLGLKLLCYFFLRWLIRVSSTFQDSDFDVLL